MPWTWNRECFRRMIRAALRVRSSVRPSGAAGERAARFVPRCRCSISTAIARAKICPGHDVQRSKKPRMNYVNYFQIRGDPYVEVFILQKDAGAGKKTGRRAARLHLR